MEVKREEVLSVLEAASVAVTDKAFLEQSDTFVFGQGELITFNGEVLIRQESPFGEEVEGSITANELLKILQRFPDESLQVRCKEGELIIKGKRRSAGVKLQAEVLLPFDDVPTAVKFHSVPEGLMGILLQAGQVCGRDEASPKTTHIHIAPDRVEATDSFRVFRVDVKTGLKKAVMVHAGTIASIKRFTLSGIGFSPDEGWLLLTTEEGATISVLCAADDYYQKKMIDDLLKVEGERAIFPPNLAEILSRAEVMDSANLSFSTWDSQVTIALKDGLLKVTSRKDQGWFREVNKVKYTGSEISFSIHPSFLKQLVRRTRKMVISERQIKVEVDNIHFVAALEITREGEDGE